MKTDRNLRGSRSFPCRKNIGRRDRSGKPKSAHTVGTCDRKEDSPEKRLCRNPKLKSESRRGTTVKDRVRFDKAEPAGKKRAALPQTTW
jgi:hypothetical protein